MLLEWPGIEKIAQHAAKVALGSIVVVLNGREMTIDEFGEMLSEGNIVGVVRCGECRWGKPYGKLIGCENENCGHSPASLVEADWFCADGERREDA